jgi:hypothetical protein
MKTPMMKAITDLAARVLGARTAVSELQAVDVALRDAHAAAEAERGRLLSARPPKAEVVKLLDAELPKLAAEWVAQRGLAVVAALGGAIEVTPAGEFRIVRYSSLTDELGALSFSALAALAPELVREGLTAVITQTPYEEGPPMADRAALIAEVDRKLEGIVKAHRDLAKNARDKDIPLPDLAITVGRRLQAEQARKRWADDGAVNRDYYRHHPERRPPEPEAAP